MANIKHFCDMDAETIELADRRCSMPNAKFAEQFPGVKGIRDDSFHMWVSRAADGRYLPVTRIIEYKARPSRHVCDVRCMQATGRTMKCECSCGGKNHGRGVRAGSFECEVA